MPDNAPNPMPPRPPTSQPGERMLKKVWTFIPTLFVLAAIVMVIFLGAIIHDRMNRLAEDRARGLAVERPPTNVVLMEVSPKEIRDRLNLPGIIEPWTDLTLLAKIQGEVIAVPVSEGDRVKKGDILVRIDPADYQLAVKSAQASHRLAASNLERGRELFARGLIPRAELENIETGVETARAAMENAELMLSRCTITAPMDGVIRRLDAKIGLLLNVGDPIGRFLQIDRVKAVVGIPESDVAAVQDINEVEITVQALGNRVIIARKHLLSASPDNAARLYNLELTVDNGDGSLLPGMFIRADVVKKIAPEAISIPLYTVVTRNREKFVYVEEEGVARKKPVELGILEDWRVEVTRGLAPGDRVIIEGHRTVEDGRRINVVRTLKGFEEAL